MVETPTHACSIDMVGASIEHGQIFCDRSMEMADDGGSQASKLDSSHRFQQAEMRDSQRSGQTLGGLLTRRLQIIHQAVDLNRDVHTPWGCHLTIGGGGTSGQAFRDGIDAIGDFVMSKRKFVQSTGSFYWRETRIINTNPFFFLFLH